MENVYIQQPPKQVPEQYYQLLQEIQAVDFVLVELTLYLDTHPDDINAINQYNLYAMKSRALKEEFETLFGPLQHFGGGYSGHPWTWSNTPWPWQI